MNRYFLPERPPMPGTIPKQGLEYACDFGDRMPIVFPNGKTVKCYGYVEYNRELSDQEIKDYELLEGE